MKGIVFTELLELIEIRFGYQMVDKIIIDSALESNGIYTAVGEYDDHELVQLIDVLTASVSESVESIQEALGRRVACAIFENHRHRFLDKTIVRSDQESLAFNLNFILQHIQSDFMSAGVAMEYPSSHILKLNFEKMSHEEEFFKGIVEGYLSTNRHKYMSEIKREKKSFSFIFEEV
jgi:hypothetical protein